MKDYLIVPVLGFFLFLSCGTQKVYFTQTSRERIEQRGSIDRIQFFTDRKLVLVHTIPMNEGIDEMNDLEISLEREFYIEIPQGTPCVAQKMDDNRLKVFFEEGDLNYLVFKSFDGGLYGLAGYYDEDNEFHVAYGGDTYDVEEGGGIYLQRGTGISSSKNHRVIKGIRVKK